MFGIIDRYIVLEVLKVFAAILSTLMLIVVSMLFLRTLEEVNVGALGSDLVVRFMGLQIVRDLASLIPPAFFISVLVALGRMARDSELIALSACGLGPASIFRSLFYFAIPVALLTGLASFHVRPLAVAEIQKILQQRKDQVQQIAGLKQGRFYQHNNPHGRTTVYVESIEDKKQLRNIFIHDRDGDQMVLVVSETGVRRVDEDSGEHFVTLYNGQRYDGVPGRPDYSIGSFERYNLRIEPREIQHFKTGKRAALQTGELVGSEDLEDRAELLDRISSPLAIFTLTLLAIPLTAKSPRQRAFGRTFLALLTYFSFFNLHRVATNWFETGVTPSWLGSLWYQAVILLLVLGVLLPETRWLKKLRRWSARS